jgi:hypothetical protein
LLRNHASLQKPLWRKLQARSRVAFQSGL